MIKKILSILLLSYSIALADFEGLPWSQNYDWQQCRTNFVIKQLFEAVQERANSLANIGFNEMNIVEDWSVQIGYSNQIYTKTFGTNIVTITNRLPYYYNFKTTNQCNDITIDYSSAIFPGLIRLTNSSTLKVSLPVTHQFISELDNNMFDMTSYFVQTNKMVGGKFDSYFASQTYPAYPMHCRASVMKNAGIGYITNLVYDSYNNIINGDAWLTRQPQIANNWAIWQGIRGSNWVSRPLTTYDVRYYDDSPRPYYSISINTNSPTFSQYTNYDYNINVHLEGIAFVNFSDPDEFGEQVFRSVVEDFTLTTNNPTRISDYRWYRVWETNCYITGDAPTGSTVTLMWTNSHSYDKLPYSLEVKDLDERAKYLKELIYTVSPINSWHCTNTFSFATNITHINIETNIVDMDLSTWETGWMNAWWGSYEPDFEAYVTDFVWYRNKWNRGWWTNYIDPAVQLPYVTTYVNPSPTITNIVDLEIAPSVVYSFTTDLSRESNVTFSKPGWWNGINYPITVGGQSFLGTYGRGYNWLTFGLGTMEVEATSLDQQWWYFDINNMEFVDEEDYPAAPGHLPGRPHYECLYVQSESVSLSKSKIKSSDNTTQTIYDIFYYAGYPFPSSRYYAPVIQFDSDTSVAGSYAESKVYEMNMNAIQNLSPLDGAYTYFHHNKIGGYTNGLNFAVVHLVDSYGANTNDGILTERYSSPWTETISSNKTIITSNYADVTWLVYNEPDWVYKSNAVFTAADTNRLYWCSADWWRWVNYGDKTLTNCIDDTNAYGTNVFNITAEGNIERYDATEYGTDPLPNWHWYWSWQDLTLGHRYYLERVAEVSSGVITSAPTHVYNWKYPFQIIRTNCYDDVVTNWNESIDFLAPWSRSYWEESPYQIDTYVTFEVPWTRTNYYLKYLYVADCSSMRIGTRKFIRETSLQLHNDDKSESVQVQKLDPLIKWHYLRK